MITKNNSLAQTKSSPRLLFAVFLMIAFGAPGLHAQEESVTPKKESTPMKVHHSWDFGWTANQEVTEEFAALLGSGKLKVGEELVLDHR